MNCVSTIAAKAVTTTMLNMNEGEYATMLHRAPDGDVEVQEYEMYENEDTHEF